MDPERFEFSFAAAYRLPALLLGITPWTSHVLLGGGRLHVRFGPWSMTTPLEDVVGVDVTGGFRWHRTAGPPHLSLTDHGVSFATNGDRAVCVRLRSPVAVLDPTGRLLRHPGVTMTVAEVDRLHDLLRQLAGR